MSTDQNRLDAFHDAKTRAEGGRQQAITDAHAAFNKRIAEAIAAHTSRYEAAREAFDAVKSDPDHPSHGEAYATFDSIRGTRLDHREARDELDAAIRKADREYRAEVARLGQEHGVVVR
jgi:phage shock protein A